MLLFLSYFYSVLFGIRSVFGITLRPSYFPRCIIIVFSQESAGLKNEILNVYRTIVAIPQLTFSHTTTPPQKISCFSRVSLCLCYLDLLSRRNMLVNWISNQRQTTFFFNADCVLNLFLCVLCPYYLFVFAISILIVEYGNIDMDIHHKHFPQQRTHFS